MNRWFSLFSFLLLAQFSTLHAEHRDYRNFALARFYPNINEIHLAEARVQRYWAKYHDHFGSDIRYLAVEVTSVLPPEFLEPLWPYLLNSDTGSMFLATLPTDQGFAQMACVMIFDTKTRHFIGRRGYLTVENPPRGTMARYEDYIACFIGSGRFL
jgi:hypothetical protein